MAQHYDEKKAEIDTLIMDIREHISKCEPLSLLMAATERGMFNMLNTVSEIQIEGKQNFELRTVEYIQSILVSQESYFEEIHSNQEELIEKVLEEVDELYMKTQIFYIFWAAKTMIDDKDLSEKDIQYIMEAQLMGNVRGKRYQFQQLTNLKTLLLPHSEKMEELYGVSAQDLLDGLEKLEYSLSSAKLDSWKGMFNEFLKFQKASEGKSSEDIEKLFDEEVEERSPRDNFFHCLVNAAHQFHKHEKNDDRYLLSGYPWFKSRARDTFVSLPGLTLAIDEQDYFELVMKTAEKGLREFMEENPLTVKIYEIEQPDVPLWAVWAIQQYAKHVGNARCIEMYGKLLQDIVKYIIDGRHPNLRLDDNGLLYTNGRDKAVTWMNSTANGRPVVPRTGYIVEFNALWYNAIKFCAALAQETGDTDFASDLERRAELCKESFVKTFLNEYGYLLDYVDGYMMDWSVRPNMIFAVAFDYSPLNQEQKKGVLDVCTRELLTPKGLRSLSPKSGGYNPMYVGPQTQRDYAYHQGTAWPWLGGFYMEACLKLYKRTRLRFIERQMVGYEDEMNYHALGTISELFDGNPPFHGRGGMSFAMNVAEILRTLKLLEKYTYQK